MTETARSRIEYGVAVADPEAAAFFYEQALGFERMRSAELPAALAEGLGLGTAGVLIWLRGPDGSVLKFLGGQDEGQLLQSVRTTQTPSQFVTVYVSALDTTVQSVTSHGATPVGPVVVGPTGVRVAFVRDPSGSLVELVQPPPQTSGGGT